MLRSSAPQPPRLGASCAITRRLVLRTLCRMSASSRGHSVRGSITSTLTWVRGRGSVKGRSRDRGRGRGRARAEGRSTPRLGAPPAAAAGQGQG
eukprot:scaffold3919_cov59-Phaeocystis_antarctica.AAC.5